MTIQISKIQFRRGLQSDLPISNTTGLDVGEVAFTTDTNRVFIGTDPSTSNTVTQIHNVQNITSGGFPYSNVEILTEFSPANQTIFDNEARNITTAFIVSAPMVLTGSGSWSTLNLQVPSGLTGNVVQQPFLISTENGTALISYHVIDSLTNTPLKTGTLTIFDQNDSFGSTLIDTGTTNPNAGLTTSNSSSDPNFVYGAIAFRTASLSGGIGIQYQINITGNNLPVPLMWFRVEQPQGDVVVDGVVLENINATNAEASAEQAGIYATEAGISATAASSSAIASAASASSSANSATMAALIAANTITSAATILASGALGVTLNNITALRANITNAPIIIVRGYYNIGDGGQGTFIWNSNDTTSSDDGGIIIVDAAGHRYYRLDVGEAANIQWFGAISDCQVINTNISIGIGSTTLISSVAAFLPGDVGKSINVTRTDVLGWNPWWGPNGNTAFPTITQYISPTQVKVSIPGGALPSSTNTASWPYNNTPCSMMWGTNNAPAIQKALNAYGAVFVPAGNFGVANQIILRSGNTLFGHKNTSKIFAIGITDDTTGNANPGPLFVNRYYASASSLNIPYGGVPAWTLQYGDNNIIIDNLYVDLTQAGIGYGGQFGRMFCVSKGRYSNLIVVGSPLIGIEGPNLVGCNDWDVYQTLLINVLNGFNPFCGCTNIRYFENTQYAFPIPSTPTGITGGGGICIGINSIGVQSGGQPTKNVRIYKNTVYLYGSQNSAYVMTGIYMFPDTAESYISDSEICENIVICQGSGNLPILLVGGNLNCNVNDNLIVGYDGSGGEPIKVEGQFAFIGPSTTPTSITTTSGSSTATINWTNHGMVGYALPYFPYFLTVNSGPTAGGTTLNGTYPIIAVTNANSFTINLETTASTGGTTNWGSGFASIIFGPTNCTIARNKLRDCISTTGSKALIYVEGSGNIIKDNDVSYSLSSIVPNYSCIVGVVPYTNSRICIVLNNTGPTGTASLPQYWSGTNRVGYVNASAAALPLIVDPDDTTQTLRTTAGIILKAGSNPAPLNAYEEGTWTPSLEFGGSTAGIVYSVQQGYYRRIGSMYFIQASLSISSVGTATGIATVGGCPGYANFGQSFRLDVTGWASLPGITEEPAIVMAGTIIYIRQTTQIAQVALTNANFEYESILSFAGWYIGPST